METEYCYTKIIVLGSGKLAWQCAATAKRRLDHVEVLEYRVTESTVLEKLCEKGNMPYLCCDKERLHRRLREETEKTLVVSAGNTYLIPKDVISRSNLFIINWHNALLPRHRGRNAEAWCIYQGDTITGITWHRLTEGVDAGDVIAQEEVPVENTVTALKLFQRQSDLGAKVFEEILDPLLMGRCRFQKQAEMPEEQIHLSWEIPNGGWLDTGWNFVRISRFLRAMDYGALQLLGEMRVRWQDESYRFSRYRITEEVLPDGVTVENSDMVICKDGHKILLRSLKKERNGGS